MAKKNWTKRAQAVSSWLDKPGPSRFTFLTTATAAFGMTALCFLFTVYGIVQSTMTVEAFYQMSERHELQYASECRSEEGQQSVERAPL